MRLAATSRDAIKRVLSLVRGQPAPVHKSAAASGETEYIGTRAMRTVKVYANGGTITLGDGQTLTLAAGTNITLTRSGAQVTIAASSTGMTSFTAAGNSGSSQTIGDGNTLSLLGGAGISSVASATDTITHSLNGFVQATTETTTGITLGTHGYVVFNNSSDIDVYLPQATSGLVGRKYSLSLRGSGKMTLYQYSGDTLDGLTDPLAYPAGSSGSVVCTSTGKWNQFFC